MREGSSVLSLPSSFSFRCQFDIAIVMGMDVVMVVVDVADVVDEEAAITPWQRKCL